MTENLVSLQYDGKQVRTVEKDGQVWWVLKDVCNVLEISNSRMVSERLDDDEKDVSIADTLGGKQELTVISESGLYNVILLSRKPEAKKFKRWVTHDVLPSIRKTGSYSIEQQLPRDYPSALRALADEAERRMLLEAKIAQDEPFTTTGKTIATVQRAIKVEEFARYVQNTYKGLGRNNLFKLLREKKVFYQYAGITMPLQEYMNRGYFVVKESTYSRGGFTDTRPTILITGKGQVWLANKLSEWMDNPNCDVLPFKSKKGGVA